MRLLFLNHAGFVIEHKGISLLCDPWLYGRIFNSGWDLISPTKFSPYDFKRIKYIWFSHEHPDHFSPPSLSSIPPEIRREITVLFQQTQNKRILRYCISAGFKDAVEVSNTPYFLANGISLYCGGVRGGDSWLHYRIGSLSVLNTNDCVIRSGKDAAQIKRIIGNVDVLLTKFSYAAWTGNPEDKEYRRKAAGKKLELMKLQADFFQPRITVPIANHNYFCHEENHYLNDLMNTPGHAYEFLIKNTSSQPVVLYPGDEYEYGQDWDSHAAIKKYADDLDSVLNRIKLDEGFVATNVEIPFEQLEEHAQLFCRKHDANFSSDRQQKSEECYIYLWDYGCSWLLLRGRGLIKSQKPYVECDVAMSSESLLCCFKYLNGMDSVRISGRMRKPEMGNYEAFYYFFI